MIPKVSIIVPVYNVEKYIEKCIQSILNQTINEIQIIIINDGSTDNSSIIIKKFSKLDTRINYIDKKNEGPGVARNIGIELALGEYIYFLDSDDWIEPTMLENLYNEAVKNNSDLLITGYLIENQFGKTFKIQSPTNYGAIVPKDQFINLFLELPPFIWQKLFRNKFVKTCKIKFENESSAEDTMFNIKSFVNAEIISINQGEYIHHIERNNSLTHSFKPNIIEVYEKLIEYYKELFINLKSDENIEEYFMNKLIFQSVKEPLLNLYCFDSNLKRKQRIEFIDEFLHSNEERKFKLYNLTACTAFERIIVWMCKKQLRLEIVDIVYKVLFYIYQKKKQI